VSWGELTTKNANDTKPTPLGLCDTAAVRRIEEELSVYTFRSVPVGAVIGNLLHDELWRGVGDWSMLGAFKNRARFAYHLLKPAWHPKRKAGAGSVCAGRILLTCSGASARLIELVEPVARHLGAERCCLLCADHGTSVRWAGEYASCTWDALTTGYDLSSWRKDFLDLWRKLWPVLQENVRRWGLPPRARHRFAVYILLATQRVVRAQVLLARTGARAVVADHDRFYLWAPLVLVARTQGVPTFALMHGTFGAACAGYYPILADTLFCWGELQREMLAAVGAARERVVVAGCPRLTRGLPLTPVEARHKMGLDPKRPVVMLATAPYRLPLRRRLVEVFGEALEGIGEWTGVVRLHSSERLEAYEELRARFPAIRFIANDEAALDVALAATDVVVVHSSGFGSDALVKSRLTVVLDVIDLPLGHGQELIDYAGCPRARSAAELKKVLVKLLYDEAERKRLGEAAEQYVARFCEYFGDDSAARIVEHVRRTA